MIVFRTPRFRYSRKTPVNRQLVATLLFGVLCTGCRPIQAGTPLQAGTPVRAGSPADWLTVSPTQLNFESVPIGSSRSQTGLITAGASEVTISSCSWNGSGYAVSGVTFPVTLAPRQSLHFAVVFTPQTSGSTTGEVSFLTQYGSQKQQWSGSGAPPGAQSIKLQWDESSSSDIWGYYVYRGFRSGGPYTRIEGLQPTTFYRDLAVTSGQSYYYVVTALGTNFTESQYSNEVVASIP